MEVSLRIQEIVLYLKKQLKTEKEAENSLNKLIAILKESAVLSKVARNERLGAPDIFRTWANKLTYRTYIKGQEIYTKDSYSDSLFIVLQGEVGLIEKKPDFQPQTIEKSTNQRINDVNSVYETPTAATDSPWKVRAKKNVDSIASKLSPVDFEMRFIQPLLGQKTFARLTRILDIDSNKLNKEASTSFTKSKTTKPAKNVKLQASPLSSALPNDPSKAASSLTATTAATTIAQNTDRPNIPKDSSMKGWQIIQKILERQVFGDEFVDDGKGLRKESAGCLSDCVHLAVLKREHYKNSMSEHSDGTPERKMHFLKRNPLFSEWTDTTLKSFFIESMEVTCKKGELVFTENEVPSTVFIVKQGVFQARKTIRIMSVDDDRQVRGPRRTREMDSAICTYGECQMFGEEDLLRSRTRNFSVICDSLEGELFVIPAVEFLIYLMTHSLSSILAIQQSKQSFFEDLVLANKRSLEQFSAMFHNKMFPNTSKSNGAAMSAGGAGQQQITQSPRKTEEDMNNQESNNNNVTDKKPSINNIQSLQRKQSKTPRGHRHHHLMIHQSISIERNENAPLFLPPLADRLESLMKMKKQILRDKIQLGHPAASRNPPALQLRSNHYQVLIDQLRGQTIQRANSNIQRVLPSIVEQTIANCAEIDSKKLQSAEGRLRTFEAQPLNGIFFTSDENSLEQLFKGRRNTKVSVTSSSPQKQGYLSIKTDSSIIDEKNTQFPRNRRLNDQNERRRKQNGRHCHQDFNDDEVSSFRYARSFDSSDKGIPLINTKKQLEAFIKDDSVLRAFPLTTIQSYKEQDMIAEGRYKNTRRTSRAYSCALESVNDSVIVIKRKPTLENVEVMIAREIIPVLPQPMISQSKMLDRNVILRMSNIEETRDFNRNNSTSINN